jgi:hypothetical protein
MKAPKRIQISFHTEESWEVPIQQACSVAKSAEPSTDIAREASMADELADGLLLLLLTRCRFAG